MLCNGYTTRGKHNNCRKIREVGYTWLLRFLGARSLGSKEIANPMQNTRFACMHNGETMRSVRGK